MNKLFSSRLMVIIAFFLWTISFCVANQEGSDEIEPEKVLIDIELKLGEWKEKTLQYYSKRHEEIDKEKTRVSEILAEFNDNKYEGSVYKIIANWRFYIDKFSKNIIGCPPQNPFSDHAFVSADLVKKIETEPILFERYKSFYDEYLKITKMIDQHQESYSRAYLDVLVLLNKCRAFILNQIQDSDYKRYFSFYQVFQDIQREMLIVPKIYFVSFENKINEINNNLQIGGTKGYYIVGSELFIWLLFIIFIGFIAAKFNVFQERIETFLDVLIDKSYKNNTLSKILVYFFEILSRSVSWILIIFASTILKWLLRHSLFFELELPLNILEIYGYYKVAFFALRYSLVRLNTSNLLSLSYAKKLILFKNFFNLLKVLFFSISTLSVINFVTAQSLLFQIVFWIFCVITVFYIFYILNQWKVSIYKSLADKVSPLFLNIIRSLLRTRFLSLLTPPLLAMIWGLVSFFSYIYYQLQRFEWMKKISAKLLVFKVRRKANFDENGIDEILPDGYKNNILLTDDIPSAMFVDTGEYFEIRDIIDDWLAEKSVGNASIAIKGYPGTGKTTLMRRLIDYYQRDALSIYIDLANVLEKDMNVDNLKKMTTTFDTTQKNIVFIDNFQKCFIQYPDRQKFLSHFLSNIMSLHPNIMVCVGAEYVSWQHMNNIKSIDSYFSNTIFLSKFSYDELKSLIEKRHKRTAYKISFSEIALKDDKIGTGKNDEDLGFEKLMKIIWQQSEKNLHLALRLWCNCLSLDKHNVLMAHYPKPLILEDYKNIDTQSLFILAAILRYAFMTIPEICFPLRNAYSEELITLKIKTLELDGIIQKNVNQSFFINPVYYRSLLKYLEVKGYVT